VQSLAGQAHQAATKFFYWIPTQQSSLWIEASGSRPDGLPSTLTPAAFTRKLAAILTQAKTN